MRIAVHQMCSGKFPQTNAEAMLAAIGQSAQSGACMYFAPEMSLMVDRNRQDARAHTTSESESDLLKLLCDSARHNEIWVHVGSIAFLRDSDDKLANRTIVIGPDGIIRARYDKMHLFDVNLSSGESWRESAAYGAGDCPVITQTPLGMMGLAICYDMRFPDLFSAYAKAGVDVLTLPSAFTVPTGEAHWHSLLRSRAIESEAFVIAAAQSGLHEDGRETFGHSLVIDPWGIILLDMGPTPGLGMVDLDLTKIAQVRAQIPVHTNRRDIPAPVIMR